MPWINIDCTDLYKWIHLHTLNNANFQDVNDITPVILSSDAIKITSDVKLNAPITKVIAADEDRGEAGRVSYHIVGGNEEELFKVSVYSHITYV